MVIHDMRSPTNSIQFGLDESILMFENLKTQMTRLIKNFEKKMSMDDVEEEQKEDLRNLSRTANKAISKSNVVPQQRLLSAFSRRYNRISEEQKSEDDDEDDNKNENDDVYSDESVNIDSD